MSENASGEKGQCREGGEVLWVMQVDWGTMDGYPTTKNVLGRGYLDKAEADAFAQMLRDRSLFPPVHVSVVGVMFDRSDP